MALCINSWDHKIVTFEDLETHKHLDLVVRTTVSSRIIWTEDRVIGFQLESLLGPKYEGCGCAHNTLENTKARLVFVELCYWGWNLLWLT